jgi:hypothetical protein
VLWISALLLAPAAAQEGDPVSESPPADEPELRIERRSPKGRPAGEGPGLDALLQLPSGFKTDQPDAVAGAGELEWRRRFRKAEDALAEARTSLAATKRELDEAAGGGGSSQWSIAPPGAGTGGGETSAANSPLSFKLRQQLRDDRERIEKAEKDLRELRIEADLAGVPQSWRVAKSGSAPEPGTPGD